MNHFFGKIVTFIDDRNFGFIRPDSGTKDVFFHGSAYLGTAARPTPKLGYTVAFDIESAGRTRAIEVTPV